MFDLAPEALCHNQEKEVGGIFRCCIFLFDKFIASLYHQFLNHSSSISRSSFWYLLRIIIKND